MLYSQQDLVMYLVHDPATGCLIKRGSAGWFFWSLLSSVTSLAGSTAGVVWGITRDRLCISSAKSGCAHLSYTWPGSYKDSIRPVESQTLNWNSVISTSLLTAHRKTHASSDSRVRDLPLLQGGHVLKDMGSEQDGNNHQFCLWMKEVI